MAKDFSHLDMLDDDIKVIYGFFTHLCKKGTAREPMRRFTGGIVAVFLRAFMEGDDRDLMSLMNRH